MVCDYCGARPASSVTTCPTCGRRLADARAGATISPDAALAAESEERHALTGLSAFQNLGPEDVDNAPTIEPSHSSLTDGGGRRASLANSGPLEIGPGVRHALPHHPRAGRRRHGRRLSGVGCGTRRRGRGQGHSAGDRGRSVCGERNRTALQARAAARARRSPTATSSAFTTSARSTASSTSRCRTSTAPTSRRVLQEETKLPVAARAAHRARHRLGTRLRA